ncbi:MAG: integrase core domain-containing protein [Balneolales bacterium]|nr:integrase core domain-containing protein [Balneolales bacterium]
MQAFCIKNRNYQFRLGSAKTCAHWIDSLTTLGIAISIDGKGRAIDNIYIESWFRTLKQRYVYLNPASSRLELPKEFERFIYRYNIKWH